MEVLSPQSQCSDDWQSLDESWDSRLPTPLALDFSSLRDEDDDDNMTSNTQRSYSNGNAEESYPNGDEYQAKDPPATPDSQHGLTTSNGFTEGETEYLQMARKGGGHSDLLKVEPHTPTSEPVKYDKKDGQWYAHNGVDVQDTQQRKEMMTVSSRSPSSLNSSVDIETDTEYLKIAKKGGGRKDLLTVDPHTPTPEPVKYDKTDGQWYTHDGVDIKETQQRKDLSLALDGLQLNGDAETAAGGKETGYLDLAKNGGGHKDLLTIEDHTPSPEPIKYEKKGGDWYNQDDMVIKDGPQDTGVVHKRQRTYSDSLAECKAETEYLRTARKGGGHKDLLTIEAHVFTPEPVKYDKKDGQWYTHDGVDVIETQARKEMVTLPSSPRPSSAASPIDIETNTDYLKIAKRGGGHKDLLSIDPHTPTPEPLKYDKTDGQWYTHDGVDVRETQQRKDLSANINSPGQNVDEIIAAGENSGDYLKLAKKGGGHQDLLTIDPHTPTPEPVGYDKTDGQWYTHNGVDVKDTQQRKEMVTVASSPRPENNSMEVETETQYLKIAKKGGGHKELLTVQPHTPTPEPVKYDKKDGQWYTHDGVNVKGTQQRKELAVTLEAQHGTESVTAAGGNNSDYLDLAKKGGGHTDLLTIDPHSPTPKPVSYDKTDGLWYSHDGVDVKDTQQRKETTVSIDDQRNSECLVAAGGNNREYLDLAKKGGGHEDLLTIVPHTPTPEPVKYDKTDGKWYTHDGVDVKETQQRRDLSTTLESIPEDLSAAGENNGEYLKMAKKGGRQDLLTIEPHTPTPEPVGYEKKDGQWYTHDGVDVKDTQQRKEMVTVVSSPRSPNLDTTKEVETETDYLKIAKKGGGHKDLLTIDPHTPTPEPVKYNKEDGQWYTHDGVDVKDTQQRKEMVTVSTSPRPSSMDSSVNIEIETDYLKIAKKGGGHKDLLTLEPHTPRSEPVKYDKTDGQWYTHDGVDVKDTQQRKEMVTVSSSPRPTNLDSSVNVKTDTEYLKIAKKGGGHKDLLTMEPHTPSPEPQRYQKNGGDWYNQNSTDTPRSSAPPSPRRNNSDDTDYLILARRGGGHSDLLTIQPHTPTPEPVKYDKTDGQWYTHDGVDVKDTQQRRDQTPSPRRSPRKNTRDSKLDINTNTEYLKIARKGGGHKDLLTHTPSPEPQRYEKKAEQNNHDSVDGNKTRDRKGPRHQNGGSSVQSSTETEYLKTAKKGGGHKDLLTIEHHKPSPKPKKQESKLGDWYYQDGSVVKDTLQRKESPSNSPRKTTGDNSSATTEYLKMARKGGGRKDLLMMTPDKATPSPKPKEVKENTDSTPISSPRNGNGTSRDSTDYLRLARKGGGHTDLLSSAPRQTGTSVADSFSAMDSPRRKEPSTEFSLRRSASMRHRKPVSDYLSTARKGGHHKDLLTMPETSNFKRDQESRRSLRSFRSPIISQVDGPSRPRTAEPRQAHPIWLGGSGPERTHSPGKRFMNPNSRFAPFAYHEGSPGAAKNPDKI